MHPGHLITTGPRKGFDVMLSNHGIVQRIVFEEKLKQGGIKREALFNTQPSYYRSCGSIPNHTLNRNHVQSLDQRIGRIQSLDEMRRDTSIGQFLHDERVELIVNRTLLTQLLNDLSIKG